MEADKGIADDVVGVADVAGVPAGRRWGRRLLVGGPWTVAAAAFAVYLRLAGIRAVNSGARPRLPGRAVQHSLVA
jgi:hypothetical protein